jgi:hypothetical protein
MTQPATAYLVRPATRGEEAAWSGPTDVHKGLRQVAGATSIRSGGNGGGMNPRRSGRWVTFVDASVHVGEHSVAQQNPSKWLSFAL